MRLYPELERAILDFLGRPLEAVGRPMLLRAVNNAKDHLQRLIDFELAWQKVSLTMTGPVSLDQLPVPMKRLCLAKDNQDQSVPLYTRAQYEALRPDTPAVVLTGTQLEVLPTRYLPFTLTLYGVQWLPDFYCISGVAQTVGESLVMGTLDITPPFPALAYRPYGLLQSANRGTWLLFNPDAVMYDEGGGFWYIFPSGVPPVQPQETFYLLQTSFLLDYCFDFLLYRGIQELNFFLKEDDRVMLSEALPARALEAIQAWNATLVNSSVDVSLS